MVSRNITINVGGMFPAYKRKVNKLHIALALAIVIGLLVIGFGLTAQAPRVYSSYQLDQIMQPTPPAPIPTQEYRDVTVQQA